MVEEIVHALKELLEEPQINKNIRVCVDRIISHLENDSELGKDKALFEIEEMIAKNNIEPYIRTQIWNVISMLESC